MAEIKIPRQVELAPATPVTLEAVRQPRYGRFLEEFEPGTLFRHPRGLTISAAFAYTFATTFMQANPLYLNAPFAQAHGFEGLLISPLMSLNLALSLGVQNDSEQAIAHLGYYAVEFPRPVYAGDTLRSETEVLSRRMRGPDKPGVVRVRTQALNQRDEIVVRYERAILIPLGDKQALTDQTTGSATIRPQLEPLPLTLPALTPHPLPPLTGSHTYFEDFRVGEIILHTNGRTITGEHMVWTYRMGNTHPLHYDRVYSAARSGPLNGEPVVYGGLIFAWLEGLASRDTGENALWDVGYTEGYHTQPVIAGDTLYAISRVLAMEDGPPEWGVGLVSFQLIGVKNISGPAALDRYGPDLFQKEIGKPGQTRLPEKVFEIERRLLIKKRAAWS